MKPRVFMIDDEPDQVRIVSDVLSEEGYDFEFATDPMDGIKKVSAKPPDLLILDIRMEKMDGLSVCRAVKADARTKGVSVVMVSAKSQESDVIVGLEMGADDYIGKPIRIGELLARIRAVLRRKGAGEPEKRTVLGPLVVDRDRFIAEINGRLLTLKPKEFELLAFFAEREGRVVTRPLISESVWGREHVPTSNTIEAHVYELRRKLGRHGHWLQSLKGVGYRFEVPDAEE